MTRGRRGLGGEKNLHSITHWSAFTVAFAGQFSALQTITLLQRKPSSPAHLTSSPSFSGERSLLEAHSMSHHQTCWVMPLTPSSSVMSKYTILHPFPICPNQQGYHSTAVLVLHPFLMESHICRTNDYSHKVVSALAGDNSLPRNGTVFFTSLPTHLSGSSVGLPSACLSCLAARLQQFFLKFVFSVLALPPSARYKATQAIPHQASASTDLPSYIPFSISHRSLKNSEGALEELFSWLQHKLFNHRLSSFHLVSMG